MSAQMTSYDTKAVEVSHVTKTFPVPRTWTEKLLRRPELALTAVNDVSFSIAPGETFSLVGESGCGKSTLARMVSGIYRPTAGSIRLFGIDTATAHAEAAADVRRRINMIFQDPYASLNPRMTVGEIIREPMVIHHIYQTRKEQDDRVAELLKIVGLKPDHVRRYPHEFSGGQRQRISIARTLALNPEFIVCDEPISALDVSIQAQVVNLLKRLQQQMGLSYLFITHDLSMVRQISNRIDVMYLGSLVEIADSEDIYIKNRHPYTKALLSAIPIADPTIERERKRILLQGDVPSPVNLPQGCNFCNRCPYATQLCKERKPQLREIEPGHFTACHRAEEM